MKQFFGLKKALFPALAITCLQFQVTAQLTIGPGVYLSSAGNSTNIVMQDVSLVNHGLIQHSSGVFRFTGNAPTIITGNGTLQFFNLVMDRSFNSNVTLMRNIEVANTLAFQKGLLELNGYTVDLLSTGHLINENESGRITGLTGGLVKRKINLAAPSAVDPGNLGAIISSPENLGEVTIQRGHQSQQNSLGTGSSVHRFYDVLPTNNTALKATLRFSYLDAELNGLPENDLVLFQSTANNNWSAKGFSSRDASGNYVEKTNLASFSRFTLSTSLNELANDCLPEEMQTWYLDADGDGYGSPLQSTTACKPPKGYTDMAGDCDDNNPAIHPSAADVCNGIDDNCDGITDGTCTTVPGLTVTDTRVYETSGEANVTVSLSAPAAGTITTKYKTVNGSASHPKDYQRVTGLLVFSAGEQFKTVAVTLTRDNKPEPAEYFDLLLEEPTGAVLADASGRITIIESGVDNETTSYLEKQKTTAPGFDVKVYNNPAATQFIIQVTTESTERMVMQVSDAQGRIIEQRSNMAPSGIIAVGAGYLPGIYFVQVLQGNHHKQIKLVKL